MSQWGNARLFEMIFPEFAQVVEAMPKVEGKAFTHPAKDDPITMVMLTSSTSLDPKIVQVCQEQLTKRFGGQPYARWRNLSHCTRLIVETETPLVAVEDWQSRNRELLAKRP